MATTPESNQSNLWNFFMALVPWATLYGLLHTAIYYVFKYWSDSRDNKIRQIVKEENEELEKRLNEKIESTHKLLAEMLKHK